LNGFIDHLTGRIVDSRLFVEELVEELPVEPLFKVANIVSSVTVSFGVSVTLT